MRSASVRELQEPFYGASSGQTSPLAGLRAQPKRDVYIERLFGTGGAMIDQLRADPMMARLLDSLDAGTDIGHYGRLVFAMIARHFGDDDAIVAELRKDKDFSEDAARALLQQVEAADYSPPKRAKIMEYQAQQPFAIIEHPDDPDAGNVYKTLHFPDHVYAHIAEYREAKALAH